MIPISDEYEMFTYEGNKAVQHAIDKILRLSYDRTLVWNQATLEAVAIPVIEEVAQLHGEVYDTEPRGHIGDFLKRICDANGWTFDRWNSNFW